MGEIDTNPIESVQVAISLFGERKDSLMKNDQELEEREVESLLKDLANVKVQLEVKDLAYKQAILKLDRYQKTQDELSTLLKNADSVKIKYIDECKESNIRINQLESTVKEMSDKILGFENLRKQHSHVKNEYMTSQGQVLNMETQLDALRRAKVESTMEVEAMETALGEEKLKTKELLMNISQLKETIFHMQMKAREADEENTEIQLATKNLVEAEAQLECTEKLEKELLEKSILADLLLLELKQANEQYSCSQKVASNATRELNQLKEGMEQRLRKNLDPAPAPAQATYSTSLETELEQSKTELTNANEEVGRLNIDVERMRAELENIRTEMTETRERDTEAQVEIALLNSELHKGRSKLAAVEAAEARAQSEKSALYHAVHELALEAEEAKKENRELKEIMKSANESKSEELVEKGELIANYEETGGGMEVLSRKEYEALIKKAERADQVELMHENEQELKNLKKELEAATLKIGEHRTRAEQAISRAEAAEKAKVELEEQKRRWKEHKERRKAALAELREVSYSKDYITSYEQDNVLTNYQPLGKVLNMKF